MKRQVRKGVSLLLFGVILYQEAFTGFFSNGDLKGNELVSLFGSVFIVISIFIIILGRGN
jgi:hypothetical protein